MTEIWENSEPDIVTGAVLVELNLTQFGLMRKLKDTHTQAISDKHGNKEMFTGGYSPTIKANKWIIPKELYGETLIIGIRYYRISI